MREATDGPAGPERPFESVARGAGASFQYMFLISHYNKEGIYRAKVTAS